MCSAPQTTKYTFTGMWSQQYETLHGSYRDSSPWEHDHTWKTRTRSNILVHPIVGYFSLNQSSSIMQTLYFLRRQVWNSFCFTLWCVFSINWRFHTWHTKVLLAFAQKNKFDQLECKVAKTKQEMRLCVLNLIVTPFERLLLNVTLTLSPSICCALLMLAP